MFPRLTSWYQALRMRQKQRNVSPRSAETQLLADFSQEEEVARWLPHDDSLFGGRSSVCWRYLPELQCAEFSGDLVVELTEEQTAKQVLRTGMCSVASPHFHTTYGCDLNFSSHIALRLKVQPVTLDRTFILNLSPVFFGEDRLLQCPFTPPVVAQGSEPDSWHDIFLPLTSFSLTWKGHLEEMNVDAVLFQRIERVGLLMAQRRSGPFSLRIKEIAVVPVGMFAQRFNFNSY